MLFYTTLLITSLLLTLAILGLKDLIVFMVRRSLRKQKHYQSAGKTTHPKNRAMGTKLNTDSPAWGRLSHASPATMAKTHPALPDSGTPWGWPGSDNNTREYNSSSAPARGATLSDYLARKYEEQQTAGDWKRNIGRPLRDEGVALSGQAYKPSEDALSRFDMEK